MNIMFNQYNELTKLLFRNNKNAKKTNQYLMGLAHSIGMHPKKDAFSEKNMASKEHVTILKEKLAMIFWESIARENRAKIEDDLTEASTEDSISSFNVLGVTTAPKQPLKSTTSKPQRAQSISKIDIKEQVGSITKATS